MRRSQVITIMRKESFTDIAGKEEKASNHQFLLFLKCPLHFEKICLQIFSNLEISDNLLIPTKIK